MKICLIAGCLYSFTTGIEVQVRRALLALVQRGHDVLVITTVPNISIKPHFGEIEGTKVYSFFTLNSYKRSEGSRIAGLMRPLWHGGDIWNFYSHRVVRRILKQESPDVVHIHNPRGLSLSVFSAVKSLGLPLVFTAHDYSLICPRYSLLKGSGEICQGPLPVCRAVNRVKKLMVDNKPDMVTAPSQFVINKINENGLFNNTKCVRLFNAISLDDACLTKKNYETIDILYSGQLTRVKGVHILIDAFKQIKHKNIRLHIVGRGNYAEELKGIARGDSRIIFHGFMQWEELEGLCKKASVTVVPSIWYEPFGLIIIESFKYGTPVIGSNIGGIPEIVDDGYNGLTFEAGNVNQLKDMLEHLVASPLELERLGQGAFESAKRFDINNYIAKLEELYEQVLK